MKINKINNYINRFNTREILCIMLVASIFLHYYVTIAFVVIFVAYSIKSRDIFKFKFVNGSLLLTFFVAYTFVVSACRLNFLGAALSLGMIFFALSALYLRLIMTDYLFEHLLKIICIMGIFSVMLSIVQHIFFKEFLEANRVSSVFLNANYFGTIMVMCVLIAAYKLLIYQKFSLFYFICLATFIIGLLISECRTAFAALFISLIAIFIICKKKYFAFITATMGALFITLANILQFSRYNQLIDSSSSSLREAIWGVSVKAILTAPLFGQGPLGYIHIYRYYFNPFYNEIHMKWHSHNLLLELLLCYGIMGTIMLIAYFYKNYREFSIRKKTDSKNRIAKTRHALICAVFISIIVHGITDYTIFWVQTTELLFVLLSGSCVYSNINKE